MVLQIWCNALPGTELLICGGSGFLYRYPGNDTEILKLPTTYPPAIRNMEIEKRVYRRLGSHPNIIKCLRIEDYGIHLERAKYGCLRQYFKDGGTATPEERIKWSRDIASALHYVHEKGVRHADLGGRNILLDSSRNVRLCDFAGSAIDDEKATVWADEGYRHPDDQEMEGSTIRAELHALGSTIYELITSQKPHEKEELEDGMLGLWIREGKYPDVKDVTLGNIIKKCWDGEYKSAKEVSKDIDSELREWNVKQEL